MKRKGREGGVIKEKELEGVKQVLQQLLTPVVTKAIINAGIVRRLSSL